MEQPTLRDDVIPAKPQCRDKSEVIQVMGQPVFVCWAALTCAATLSEIDHSFMPSCWQYTVTFRWVITTRRRDLLKRV